MRSRAATASRHLMRWTLWMALLLIGTLLAVAGGFTLYAVSVLPPLQRWHTERLQEEFSARRDAGLDFAAYLQLEARLFDELHDKTITWDSADEGFAHSRFNRTGVPGRLAGGAPYNRSFRLTPEHPVGQALLVHGLTDSPYSMKALAESLHARGFEVTVLRLPGHGTLPSMLTEMSAADWTAALRLAARDVLARLAPGQPFYVGGYSTGGTLALQYALDALEDRALRRPDRVLLISPAIELTPVAMLAEVIDFFSLVPIPVLEKVRWQEIVAEYDPYKFNSFPVNASRQVNRVTRTLVHSLGIAAQSGRIAQLAPVVAWQSVVDSTVGSTGVADRLFAHLHGAQHRLVLFDVNRSQAWRSLQRPAAREQIERLRQGAHAYTLDVATNDDTQNGILRVHRHAPDGTQSPRDTTLAWPAGLVSLGHVALPFLPDDPVYGFVPGSGHAGLPSIGSLLLRGESGAITLALGSLTRLRSNPFWSLIDADVAGLAAADVAAALR